MDYFYINLWDGGLISRSERNNESENPEVVPKGAIHVFQFFPVLYFLTFDSLLVFDGLTVFRLWGTKNTGYAWLGSATVQLYDLIVAYLSDARLTTVRRRERYVSRGVYNLFLTPAHDLIQNCIRDWTRN